MLRFAVFAVVAGLSPLTALAEPLPRPNIVFIMADDLGWADVEFHGGNVPTPNLNRLAREGLELQRHYVAPVCSPTRTGLMTGRYWSRFHITTPTNRRALPFDTITAARILGAAGYDTALIGKWHLGSLPECSPKHFGFDYSYGSLAGGVTPWSHRYKKGPYSQTWHRNGIRRKDEGYVTDLLADDAVRWIEARGERPFFLYVPFTAVHLPIREPEKWLRKVPPEIEGEVARHYAACVMHLDDAVGRIVDALERTGKGDNTLVVFTSDNGGSTAENNDTKYPNLGDDCPNGRLTGNNTPLRGQKGSLYEGGTRVPTLVYWPGHVPAGKADSTPVHIVDWLPTFATLARTPFDRSALHFDGADLSRLLLHGEPLPPRVLYSAGPRFRSRAVWNGPWKLIVSYTSDDRERKVELFNLASDPREEHNLADAHPTRLEQMRQMLQAAMLGDGEHTAAHRYLPSLESTGDSTDNHTQGQRDHRRGR